MRKRKHHYVWRYYLKSWSLDKQIFCLRDKKIFKPNLMGIANKRDFYKLKEITEADIDFIKKFLIDQSSSHLQEVHLRTLGIFTLTQNIIRENQKLQDNGLESDQKIEDLIFNFEEDMHGKIEEGAIKHINSILNRSVEFFQIEDERLSFLHFLCTQYFRTEKIKSNIFSSFSSQAFPSHLKNSLERSYNILSHMFSYNVSFSLVCDSSYRILLVINDSDIPFITGDQPVLNTFANGKPLKEIASETEFYYPVSPQIAILITNKKEYANIDNLSIIKPEIIHQYNSLIIWESHEQVYSNKKEILEYYR